uniref:Uncharacterized protein n=1 Tax=Arundo donax TaxID=35708 RepID=A0A0A9AHC8_ARUDO
MQTALGKTLRNFWEGKREDRIENLLGCSVSSRPPAASSAVSTA